MTIGLSDILSTQQNGVAALRDLNTTLGAGGGFASFPGGAVTGLNSLSTTAVQAVGANAGRLNLTFHNPGTVTAFVYPNTGAGGTPLTPLTSAVGGSFMVVPGGFLTVVDATNGAWSAFSSSGSNNPLTVMDRS
jgi:hypothetical protein